MFIKTENRTAIMQYLFTEGVIVAQKSPGKKHPDLPVPNLEVIQLMRGFTSKQYVKQQYAWRHYYWYLTNDGINYLRETLHLPADIVPKSLKKTARSMQEGGPQGADADGGARRFGGRGGGGWDEEKRVDPEDGQMHSKREFIDKYGNFDAWDAARPSGGGGGGGGGGGAWGGGAGRRDQETRADPQDGQQYSKRQFVDKYGGYAEWDKAGPPRERAPRGNSSWDDETAEDTDGTVLTKRQFFDKYGGFAEWDRCRPGGGGGGGGGGGAPAADAEDQTW